MERARFCHLTVDSIQKEAYVWHEADWKFSDDWHSHAMGQLIFVEKGVQYLHTQERTYLLPTHHCAWIPSGLMHKTSAPVSPVYLRCIFISKTGRSSSVSETDDLLYRENDRSSVTEADDVCYKGSKRSSVDGVENQLFKETDNTFFKELNIFNTPKVLREMILFTEQWSRLEETDPLESDFLKALTGILPVVFKSALPLVLPVPQNPRIAKMIDYLTENVAAEIKIPEVAAKFNLSARTMERLFKQDIGITVAGYIKLYKIIKAVELLSVSGENVKSVALKVGYDSVSTFSNTFFNLLGVRPQEMIIS